MLFNAVLRVQINLRLWVKIIIKGSQNLERILKELGLCANRELQVMDICLPWPGGDVFIDGVLVEVGGTVVVLGRMLD